MCVFYNLKLTFLSLCTNKFAPLTFNCRGCRHRDLAFLGQYPSGPITGLSPADPQVCRETNGEGGKGAWA